MATAADPQLTARTNLRSSARHQRAVAAPEFRAHAARRYMRGLDRSLSQAASDFGRPHSQAIISEDRRDPIRAVSADIDLVDRAPTHSRKGITHQLVAHFVRRDPKPTRDQGSVPSLPER